MHPKLIPILNEFIQRHELSSLIVYGSYVRGDFTDASDVDLLGIKETGPDSMDTRVIDGLQLDGWIYSAPSLTKTEDFLRLHGGKVYFDESGKGAQLMTEVQTLFESGPAPLSANEREHLQAWIQKMLRRAETPDLEGLFRMNWLIHELL